MSETTLTLQEPREYRIGRGQQCDLVLSDPAISRLHALVRPTGNATWLLHDPGSSTGTWLGEQRIQEHALQSGEILRLGIERLRFLQDAQGSRLEVLDSPTAVSCPWPSDGVVYLGRGHGNTIDITHPQCPHHLRKINRQDLTFPARIAFSFGCCEFSATTITWTPAPIGIDVAVHDLGVEIPERTLLKGIYFDLHPGELLGIIGRSGQGKSTLLQSLAGIRAPSHGTITLADCAPNDPRMRGNIAFLLQEAPLHPWLTVEESLREAARMRLPRDMGNDELEEQVVRMMREVGLHKVRHTRTAILSGGERRRAALAQQLLAEPGLLLLDEPFAGLDPLSVDPLASWFRQLSWRGQTIALTTHDYAIWPHCDKVLILHEGFQAFFGTPENALHFFNARHAQEVLAKLQTRSGEEWHNAFLRANPGLASEATQIQGVHAIASPHPVPERTSTRSSFPVILQRFVKSVVRDHGRLGALLLQPLIIGFLLAVLFDEHSSLWVAAFALNLCANWFAMSGAIREVIQEKLLLQQEIRQGLSPLAYFAAKGLGLGVVASAQTLLCGMILILRMGIHPSLSEMPLLLLSLLAPPLCAGLAASTLSRTAGQANALLPLLLIPQVMFAGALVPLDLMHPAGQWIAHGLWSSWSQSALQSWFLGNSILPLDLEIPLLISVGISILCAWAARPATKKNFRGSSTKTTI